MYFDMVIKDLNDYVLHTEKSQFKLEWLWFPQCPQYNASIVILELWPIEASLHGFDRTIESKFYDSSVKLKWFSVSVKWPLI